MVKVFYYSSIAVAAVICGILLSAFTAYVSCDIWAWFITPWLHVTAPTIVQMCGVYLLVSLVMATRADKDKKEKDKEDVSFLSLIKTLSVPFFSVAFVWFVGWILYLITI